MYKYGQFRRNYITTSNHSRGKFGPINVWYKPIGMENILSLVYMVK